MSSVKYAFLILLLLLLGACGEIVDDLTPSDNDQRPTIEAGTTGWEVTQMTPPFSVLDINGASVNLTSVLSGNKGAVLYFTMWCDVCGNDMMDILFNVIPVYSDDYNFFAVDYLSGSITDAKAAASNAGFLGSQFTILADLNQQLLSVHPPPMGTTVVIDSLGVIRMNELYKDGARLRSALSTSP